MAVDTSRIDPKKQSIKDAYEVPDNFLEIDVCNPQTHGVGKKRYTDYEVRMRVSRSLWNGRIIIHELLPFWSANLSC